VTRTEIARLFAVENAIGVSADFPALVGETGQTICMAKKA